jgi:hypothetical protein
MAISTISYILKHTWRVIFAFLQYQNSLNFYSLFVHEDCTPGQRYLGFRELVTFNGFGGIGTTRALFGPWAGVCAYEAKPVVYVQPSNLTWTLPTLRQ